MGRSTLGWGEGAFLGVPGRTSFSLWCVPPLFPGAGMVRPTLLVFPPLLPSQAVSPPPSWHVRLRERAKPWLWGAGTRSPSRGGQQDPPSPPPLPAPEQGFDAREGQPGSCQARGGGAGGASAAPPGPAVPPPQGEEGLVTAGQRQRSGAGCGAGRPAPWGRGGEGGAWGGRNHRGGVGR